MTKDVIKSALETFALFSSLNISTIHVKTNILWHYQDCTSFSPSATHTTIHKRVIVSPSGQDDTIGRSLITSINFHSEQLRGSYATRQATGTWKTLIGNIVDLNRRHVADIGCGGGIYTKAMLEMDAGHVTCIDSSDIMLSDARSKLKAHSNVAFLQGDALHSGAQDQQFHIVLERALIHHLQTEELKDCFTEALRILKPGSTLIVQDRTPEDCLLPGSQTNIRGYFFARYPRLAKIDVARRHTNATVQTALHEAGFRQVEKRQLWETRQIYANFAALEEDLKTRAGRSILHELSDDELKDLIDYIHRQLESDDQTIVEQDRWTLWSALR